MLASFRLAKISTIGTARINRFYPCRDLPFEPASWQNKAESKKLYNLIKILRKKGYTSEDHIEARYSRIDAEGGDGDPNHERFQCESRSLIYNIFKNNRIENNLKCLFEDQLFKHYHHRRMDCEWDITQLSVSIKEYQIAILDLKYKKLEVENDGSGTEEVDKIKHKIKHIEDKIAVKREKLKICEKILKEQVRSGPYNLEDTEFWDRKKWENLLEDNII